MQRFGKRFLIIVIIFLLFSSVLIFNTLRDLENLNSIDNAINLGEMKKSMQLFRMMHRISLARYFGPAGRFQFLSAISSLQEGNETQAVEQFEQINENSLYYLKARRTLANVYLERGEWRKAEETLSQLIKQANFERLNILEKVDVYRELDRYYRMQGRFADAAKIILKVAAISDDPIPALREHWRTAHGTIPFQVIEAGIRTCESLNPQDSRLWLAKAIIAIERNDLITAEKALKVCEEMSRSPDSAVFMARVRLSLISGSVQGIDKALRAIVGSEYLSTVELLKLADDISKLMKNETQRNEIYRLWNRLDGNNPQFLERYASFISMGKNQKERDELNQRRMKSQISYDAYQKMLIGEKNDVNEQWLIEMIKLAQDIGNDAEALILATMGEVKYGQNPYFSNSKKEIEPRIELARQSRAEAIRLLQRLIEFQFDGKQNKNGSPPESDPAISELAQFDDITEKSGFRFQYENGETDIRQMPVALGGGVGLIDFDRDGLPDIYAVQGGPFPPGDSKATDGSRGDRLFRNKGQFQFEDVTERLQLPAKSVGYGHGVAVGDVNNDRFPDLFVTRFGGYALYLNNEGKSFINATEKWGLGGGQGWPSSAAFADFDNDGDLDLYVCHYVKWDAANPRICRNAENLKYISCNPTSCDAEPDHLFRNDGNRFTDVSDSAGITASDRDGRGLGVIAADFDSDGLMDLFVANDKSANFLFKNRGGFQFEEMGHLAGVAAGADGSYQAGMGVACGDFNGDLMLDIAVTNYYGESTTLYQNTGNLFFIDRTSATGLASASRLMLGFGISFLDANNDGRLDMLSANGHTDDFGDVPYRMPSQLLMGGRNGRWLDATPIAGNAIAKPRLGRGLATGDLNNDGLTDAVLMPQNEPAVILRNVTETKNHWLLLRLSGEKTNRDGVGAAARLRTSVREYLSVRFGGGSYQSAIDSRIHLSWPEAEKALELVIQWPSGERTIIANPPIDCMIEVDEAKGYNSGSTPQPK